MSTYAQDECDTFKHDLTGDFDDTETVCAPVDPVDVIEVAGPSTKGKQKVVRFDEYAHRCFIIEALEPPSDAKIKTESPGVFISKKLFNLETYDPIGTKRITTVWEDNTTTRLISFDETTWPNQRKS